MSKYIPPETQVIWEADLTKYRAKQEVEYQAKLAQEKIERTLASDMEAKKSKIEYSEELAKEICERISAGELLINICYDYHMPNIRRCNSWLKAKPDFQSLFQASIQDRLSIFEEQVIAIADDMANDFKEIQVKNTIKRVIDPEVIARAKLRIDVRFKHLKAGRPTKWGDTSTLITKDTSGDDPEQMSQEELERRIADLDAKESVIKVIK